MLDVNSTRRPATADPTVGMQTPSPNISDAVAEAASAPQAPKGWNQSHALRDLRRAETSLRSRLLSIESDALRALSLYVHLCPSDRGVLLPLFANARAGCWYVPPIVCGVATQVASFKSSDGHAGVWAMSMRRPNMHFFRAALAARGAVLFDATRAGKSFPDALAKTVPIWCAAVSLLAGLVKCADERCGGVCVQCIEGALHLWPGVCDSERAQIGSLLPRWLRDWAPARGQLRAIAEKADASMPLRAVWTAPGRATWGDGLPSARDLGFVPVVCVSVSAPQPVGGRRDRPGRMVEEVVGGVSFPKREVGYCFVQGAGDDEESWCNGLNARAFWKFRESILSCTNHDDSSVQAVVNTIVQSEWTPEAFPTATLEHQLGQTRIAVHNTSALHVHAMAREAATRFALVIVLGTRPPDHSETATTPVRMHYYPLENRRGKQDPKYALCRALGPVLTLLRAACMQDGATACIKGVGRHGGDCAAGVAVAWLAWHCQQDGDGFCVAPTARAAVSKRQVQTAMLAVLGERADLAMSRATLLQINRFFQSPCPPSRVAPG